MPDDLVIEKLEFPIFESVIPEGEPIALNSPSLILSVFELEL